MNLDRKESDREIRLACECGRWWCIIYRDGSIYYTNAAVCSEENDDRHVICTCGKNIPYVKPI